MYFLQMLRLLHGTTSLHIHWKHRASSPAIVQRVGTVLCSAFRILQIPSQIVARHLRTFHCGVGVGAALPPRPPPCLRSYPYDLKPLALCRSYVLTYTTYT